MEEIKRKALRELFPNNLMTLEELAEEAAEVIQAKSKIIRFGLKDIFNDTVNEDQTNQEKLEAEIGHFLAVVDVLIANDVIRKDKLEDAKPPKWNKMKLWSQYKGTKGKEGDI